jgi:hypothetical protein
MKLSFEPAGDHAEMAEPLGLGMGRPPRMSGMCRRQNRSGETRAA